jgi:hypothetical protein
LSAVFGQIFKALSQTIVLQRNPDFFDFWKEITLSIFLCLKRPLELSEPTRANARKTWRKETLWQTKKDRGDSFPM